MATAAYFVVFCAMCVKVLKELNAIATELYVVCCGLVRSGCRLELHRSMNPSTFRKHRPTAEEILHRGIGFIWRISTTSASVRCNMDALQTTAAAYIYQLTCRPYVVHLFPPEDFACSWSDH
jgi:hypothetical protein